MSNDCFTAISANVDKNLIERTVYVIATETRKKIMARIFVNWVNFINKRTLWILIILEFGLILILIEHRKTIINLMLTANNTDPKIDRRPLQNEAELLREIRDTLKSVPDLYLRGVNIKNYGYNETCALYPDLFDLEINNLYWQSLYTSDGNLHLLNAYLDVRELAKPSVRILGVMNRREPNVSLYCQLWFKHSKQPIIRIVAEKRFIWVKEWGPSTKGLYEPYLFSCVLPDYLEGYPKSVSLVENWCDTSTTNLKIIYNPSEKKKDFAVCVKGLDFLNADLSVRLAEWIELNNILGAEKIFMYALQTHKNITKLLNYYTKQGKVEVTPINLPGGQPNIPSYQHLLFKHRIWKQYKNELIPYNDCFYKHMYEYKYIALLDIDEVLMPENQTTWKDLMKNILVSKGYNPSYIFFRNAYFFDEYKNFHYNNDIPKYFHMLQHLYRAKNFSNPYDYVKSFYNTETVLTLHNHLPFSCLGKSCDSYYAVKTDEAHLHHYRKDCHEEITNCDDFKNNIVEDPTILRYKDELIKRVQTALTDLGYF